ncbi:threonine dehydrogenase-like Zn-dependent dehydrogenase [Erwinia persicina]|jgi:threonine dehydrogenase-like Zn-dependent dehydrogenase|uniref:zinc-dependent alcohol dehydrogenase n=1 Tax=Erwinia persicina TaxID=55211 RepID=UPI00209DB4BB|nr:zinc-dependent alcohol dehydrogenase [Erwinia persicina]MCP1436919.1 threonine dehydrogenase-like Zn-dependent dehydrogenase [Erwinia persicina]
MKALVWHAVGDIRLDDVPEPAIEKPTDAVIRLTASAICGTDLHFVRGTFSKMQPGTILGHEGVGVIEALGDDVRNFAVGDRVVVCSTVSCGTCPPCREGNTAQCDNANPNGPAAGTCFFGGPAATGPVNGLQAEKARIPYAANTLVKIPDNVSDEQALMVSDIFPTAWFGAEAGEIKKGDVVAVFGCGPVGQFAIASAFLKGAARVIAVDGHVDRLAMARRQGAFTVNFEEEDPVETLNRLTGGVGADCAIDAVGVDSQHAHHGPAAEEAQQKAEKFAAEVDQVAPETHPQAGNWVPGDAPTQALEWAIATLKKAGRLSIIGVYPPEAETFPIGKAMNKNLTLKMGNCNHHTIIPGLLELVRTGAIDPVKVLTKVEPLSDVLDAYKVFDKRQPGWIKTELVPQS